MRMANEVEVCDMSKKLIMGAVMALALVVCIPQTASAKTKWKLSATSKNLQVGKTSKLTVKNVPKKAKVKWKRTTVSTGITPSIIRFFFSVNSLRSEKQ